MSDMEKDVFAHTVFGKLALKKMQPVPENFRLFQAGGSESNRKIGRSWR